jgi:hypothetical protein
MTLISQLTQALRLADTTLAADGHDAAAQPRIAIHLALIETRIAYRHDEVCLARGWVETGICMCGCMCGHSWCGHIIVDTPIKFRALDCTCGAQDVQDALDIVRDAVDAVREE